MEAEDYNGIADSLDLDRAFNAKMVLVSRALQYLKKKCTLSDMEPTEKANMLDMIEAMEVAYYLTPSFLNIHIGNSLVSKVLAEEPKVDVEALKIANRNILRGNKAMQVLQFSDAVTYFSKAIAANPLEPMIYVKRARAYSRSKQYQEAISDCETALSMEDDFDNHYEAHKILGFIHTQSKNWTDAAKEYNAVEEAKFKDSTYRENYAKSQRSYCLDLVQRYPITFRLFEILIMSSDGVFTLDSYDNIRCEFRDDRTEGS